MNRRRAILVSAAITAASPAVGQVNMAPADDPAVAACVLATQAVISIPDTFSFIDASFSGEAVEVLFTMSNTFGVPLRHVARCEYRHILSTGVEERVFAFVQVLIDNSAPSETAALLARLQLITTGQSYIPEASTALPRKSLAQLCEEFEADMATVAKGGDAPGRTDGPAVLRFLHRQECTAPPA